MATAISDQELSPPSSNAGDEDEGLIKWKKAIRDQVEEVCSINCIAIDSTAIFM